MRPFRGASSAAGLRQEARDFAIEAFGLLRERVSERL